MGAYEQHIYQPTLAIFGDYDMVPKSKNLANRVSDLEVVDLPCGHWIQQELPEQTNAAMLDWLRRHYPGA
jgi:pimeloyl-ACP methyl ester carboxylesterase